MRYPLSLALSLATCVACSTGAITSTDTGSTPATPGGGSGGTTGGTTGGTSDSTPTPVAGVVTGLALDTRGQPIAGATVWMEPALTTGLVRLHTGDDGRYTARGLITNIPYYAKAWTQVAYHGRDYCVRLANAKPSDADSFVPDHQLVRDFHWQLQGSIPDLDGQYFGGEVLLVVDSGTFARGDSVELTLTPNGPLVDGSAGRVLTRRVVPNDLATDIPNGVYTVTAVLIGADGTRTPLNVGRQRHVLAESATLDWEPLETTTGCGGINSSGLSRSFLNWSRR